MLLFPWWFDYNISALTKLQTSPASTYSEKNEILERFSGLMLKGEWQKIILFCEWLQGHLKDVFPGWSPVLVMGIIFLSRGTKELLKQPFWCSRVKLCCAWRRCVCVGGEVQAWFSWNLTDFDLEWSKIQIQPRANETDPRRQKNRLWNGLNIHAIQ